MIRRGSNHHNIRRPHRPVRKTEPAKREEIATPVNNAPDHSAELAKFAVNLMFLAIIYSIFFILPCLFFLLGISSMQYIITMKSNPTLDSMVKFLIDMTLKAVQ